MAATTRSFVSGNFSLSLDGVSCGMIQKVEGGNISGEVAEIAQNGGYFRKKHLTTVKYNPIKIQMAGIKGNLLYDKIKALLAMNHQYLNGAIHALDFNMKTKSIREFTNALITEVGLPACDGASKETGYLSVTLDAEKIRTLKGDDSGPQGDNWVEQKRLHSATFRLTVDKVKEACKRVAKVDALTVKCPAQRDDIGDAREMELVPGKCDFPNLSFTVSEVDADAIYAWHEDFVIKGNCGEDMETTAELVYLSQDRAKELVRVTMKNIGIFNITSDASEDHKDAIKRCKVECYMESLELDFPGA